MLKLRLQFFIVMLVIFSLLTTGLYVFIKLSFKQDFWKYIEQKETRFAQPLIVDLTKNFHEQKSWEWISDWESYVVAKLESGTREYRKANPKQFGDPIPEPPSLAPDGTLIHQEIIINEQTQRMFREWRRMPPMFALRFIFLLDADRELIAGKKQDLNEAFLIPLMDENRVVGYLGIPYNPAVRDLQDADFAQGQEHKLSLIILIALVIAGLASFPLAHLLTKRINYLVRQVNLFSAGNYREKVSLKGHDELTELAQHLNNLGETLERSENTRRQWVADISHELRTPIAVLQAELEAVEDGVRPMDSDTVTRLISHSQRLKHLVNDLYELSLTDLGGMTYRKNTMDLASLLQESVNNMQPQFSLQDIELKLSLPNSPVMIFGDHNRLQQLFVNLLKNSLQYTNAPGITLVSLKVEQQQAIISVEDTAPGVAEEHHEKLFERLYRADSSRHRTTGGAGLGLSICKNIVTAHEGKITTGNSELGGLKITINLPCAKDHL
ncbi:two-component sensor histidine kinase [Cellvibrio zantedeschiae]|uniref:histidine kinase n=1 Tax=Cellvibrio zantedeschiae TaxID=1237077 RepID=A0ABQ3AU18_9GAMM|nr:ATP-binding protein [Cellvibrio zantedeschiae]GGY65361.1 two-component sensor histidine kinase [Cellvibrio zantedeschiae]